MKAVLPIFSCMILCSCQIGRHSPVATVFPSGKIVASGDAQAAAHVTETTTQATLPIAIASTVVTSPADGTVKIQVSQPTTMAISTKSTHIDGPQAYAPPSPPTPIEQAQGTAFKWCVGLSLLSLIGAGLFAWGEHWLSAVKCACASASFILLGKFIDSRIAFEVGGGLIVAAVVFFVAWHIEQYKKNHALLTVKIP